MHGSTGNHGFEYAPAPESRAIVDIKPSYGLFIDGEFVDGHGTSFKTINPATEEVLAEVAEADEADVDARRRRPPAAPTTRVWSRMPGARARASTSTASPGSSRSAARELAVLESHRQRQADQGVARRRRPARRGALLLLRRLGRQARVRRLRRRPAAARRRRPGHPVELPAADAGLEDRPGAGLRQHGRAQAGRDHAADRAAVRRDLPAGRPAAGRGQHRHRRRRRPAGRWSTTPTSTRSPSPARPRSARRSPRAVAGTAQEGHPRARRQGRQHRLRRRPDRPGRRGHRQRHLLQPGPRLLRRLAAAGAGVVARRGARPRSSAGCPRCASATRSTRTPTSARSTPPSSWPGSASCPTSARPRAPSAGRRRASCPTNGLLVPADDLHRRHPGPPDRPRGDLRPGAVGADLPHARPRRSRRPTTRRTACPPASGPTRARASCGWPTSCAPAWSGPTRSTSSTRRQPVRRLQGVRLRPRGRPPRPGGLPEGSRR